TSPLFPYTTLFRSLDLATLLRQSAGALLGADCTRATYGLGCSIPPCPANAAPRLVPPLWHGRDTDSCEWGSYQLWGQFTSTAPSPWQQWNASGILHSNRLRVHRKQHQRRKQCQC